MTELDHYMNEMCDLCEGDLYHQNLGWEYPGDQIYAVVCDLCGYTYSFSFNCKDCVDLLRV